jgi:LysR family transcriptional regulator for bpeEF and oprC
VWIVYPQKKHLSARVQAFIEWVHELFQRTNVPACRMGMVLPGAGVMPAPGKGVLAAGAGR